MIRQTVSSDSENVAKLIINGWQTAYRGLIDNSFLDNMQLNEMCENWKKNILSQNNNNHIYVYEENDKILGIIRFGKPDEKDNVYNAEIHVLYVEPSLKGTGIGSKLFKFAKDYFIENNLNNMIIWCLKENTPSLKFYKKMGGQIKATRKAVINNIELEEYGIFYNLSDITIEDYNDAYAKQISSVIVDNLLKINSKDYGIEFAKKHSEEFTVSKILETFPKRTKVFVALQNNTVVGTAGLDKSWYSDDAEYWILTVFVDINHHKMGIGKTLIENLEDYAKTINAKKLVVPASIAGCEFYHKLGYNYVNGKKELNKDKMYIMEKLL